MIKIALIAGLSSVLGATTVFFAAGRITYSGLQFQLPFHTALKVTPDPSNIWSWHHEQKGDGTIPVVVDFDNNGKMDTENKCFRVMITDLQIAFPGSDPRARSANARVSVESSNGPIWDLFITDFKSTHFTTPLVLPVDSALKVRVEGFHTIARVFIHMTGRLVSL